MLNFGVSHSPIKLQLLQSHSVWQLCEAICRWTAVGANPPEGVNSHLWHIDLTVGGEPRRISADGPPFDEPPRKIKLSSLLLQPGAQLKWTYDYGSTMVYTIKFVGATDMAAGESARDFPRKLELPPPAGFQRYAPPEGSPNLDAEFAGLSKWAFAPGGGAKPKLHFFRAGKKRTQNGYAERDLAGGVQHCIFLPAMPPKDLAEYLHCFDLGARVPYARWDGHPRYNWMSVVVLPAAHATRDALDKWREGSRPGFCECVVAGPRPPSGISSSSSSSSSSSAGAGAGAGGVGGAAAPAAAAAAVPAAAAAAAAAPLCLNESFPKLAALAGFRKDARVKNG